MTGETPAHGVPLVNTRTTFQRTRDARFFTGRIRNFSEDVVSVLCSGDAEFESGDRFAFHVFGSGHEAFFFATFRREAPTQDSTNREFVFLMEGEIRLRESTQDPRFATRELFADIEVPGFRKCDSVKVLDISANGLCTLCPVHIRKGDQVNLIIHLKKGFIQASAEVRYCIRDRLIPHHHRVGLRLQTMDRVSVIRWRDLYGQVVHASRYNAYRPLPKAS